MATPKLERLARLSIMTSIWYNNKSPSFCRKLNSLCVLCTNITNMQLMLLHCFDVVGLGPNRKERFFGNNHKQEGVNRLENLFFPPF